MQTSKLPTDLVEYDIDMGLLIQNYHYLQECMWKTEHFQNERALMFWIQLH